MWAIYQIQLDWKTYKYYYETDELAHPTANPTQEKLGFKSGLNATAVDQIEWFLSNAAGLENM